MHSLFARWYSMSNNGVLATASLSTSSNPNILSPTLAALSRNESDSITSRQTFSAQFHLSLRFCQKYVVNTAQREKRVPGRRVINRDYSFYVQLHSWKHHRTFWRTRKENGTMPSTNDLWAFQGMSANTYHGQTVWGRLKIFHYYLPEGLLAESAVLTLEIQMKPSINIFSLGTDSRSQEEVEI